jgi:hypothetical protein
MDEALQWFEDKMTSTPKVADAFAFNVSFLYCSIPFEHVSDAALPAFVRSPKVSPSF